MKKKLVLTVIVLALTVLLGYSVLARDTYKKLYLNEIYTGYNQVFPISDGSFTIYSGHGFVKYSPDSGGMVVVSADTAAVLKNISVSSDGSTAVAYAEYVDGSDILATNHGIYSNSWVRFNLLDKSVVKLGVDAVYAFALNDQKVAALVVSEAGNNSGTATDGSNFIIIGEGDSEKVYASYTGRPSQVRELGDSLIVLSDGVAGRRLHRVSEDSSELIAQTSTRSSLSPDGSYYYSIEYTDKNPGLVDRGGVLNVHHTETKKLELSRKLSPGLTVNWAGGNLLADTNVQDGHTTITAFPSKDQKKYLISGSLSGVSLPLNHGLLNVTPSSISKTIEASDNEASLVNPLIERSGPGYGVHLTGRMVVVHTYDGNVPSIISEIKASAGNDYASIGFIFNQP